MNFQERSVLMEAIIVDDVETVRRSVCTEQEVTNWANIAATKGSLASLKYLVSRGAQIKDTLLEDVIWARKTEVALFLLKQNVCPNGTRGAPLRYAAKTDNMLVMRELIKAGASLEKAQSEALTFQDITAIHGLGELKKIINEETQLYKDAEEAAPTVSQHRLARF